MKKIINEEKKYLMSTYNRLKINFVKGKGMYLYDKVGRKYLDFLSGIAVCSFGHGNSKINSAIKKQVDKLLHVSNWFYMDMQVHLAKKLIKLYGKNGKVFFSNSGAEANECAIKLARKWGKLYKKHEIITFKNSFHGRTLTTLAATGQKSHHVGFDPLPSGFKYAEFNDINSFKKLINKKTCAVLLEVIQGEGGINIANKEFIKAISSLSKNHNFLIICDEIQVGLGRTGRMFGYEHYSIKPDIVTLAKSLASGLPIGATISDDKVASVFEYGSHGSTFGGNLVSCSAAIQVLSLLNTKVLKHVAAMEKYFLTKLKNLKKKHKIITDVRAKGLLVAVDLTIPGRKIVEECLKKGVIINVTNNKTLRFLPPFIVTKKHVDKLIKVLEEVLELSIELL